MNPPDLILGAGVTGLSAGIATGLPVYEAAETPGGICSSYYVDGYRFEKGGGHWIFGADKEVYDFIIKYSFLPKTYERKASVYFPDTETFVPYPIQNYIENSDKFAGPAVTMKDWLAAQFGESLCQQFFYPFNERYTAGLYSKIAPQDPQKSPVTGNGYNSIFLYPPEGLDKITKRMADDCDVRYGKEVFYIDYDAHKVHFRDGTFIEYSALISTLPLNFMVPHGISDPHTSVLVLNIGAKKGRKCPKDHWLYIPESESGFHRVGFYSNVDTDFLPNNTNELVSLYVEMSYIGDQEPTQGYVAEAIRELQSWGFIDEVEVVSPTMIPVAYTWRWPGSTWREDAIDWLAKHNIYQVGRYARWRFQGIAESIKEGLKCSQC